MKISRPKIIMCALFLGLVVLVRFAMRDMNLNVDLLRESIMKMPGVVMENIQMSRVISGDTWRVKVPVLEQEGNSVNMRSIDIRRYASSDRGEWYFFGREGTYDYEQKAAKISGLLGTIDDGVRVWNLESKKLDWQDSQDNFTFPEGLTVYDDEFLVRAPLASMDRRGVILLEQGGVIQWARPLER